MTQFPIDLAFVAGLIKSVGNRDAADVPTEVQLLDGRDRPICPVNGLRIEIYRLGANPWQSGRVAVIVGQPDANGRLKTTIRLPIDSTTLLNFSLLAVGRGT